MPTQCEIVGNIHIEGECDMWAIEASFWVCMLDFSTQWIVFHLGY